MVSVPGPTRPSRIRVRQGAPDEIGGSSSGLEHLFRRRSVPGRLHPWARAGSRRFPGDPSQAFALLQDLGRAGKTSPLAVVPTPPPAKPDRRPQRVHNLEANTGLQLPLSTLRERRRRLPRKTRFRPAGCASTGRESNPLDRFERFQVTSILLSRTSPVARFVYAKPPFARPEAVLAYLARYTHRVAISNSRLVALGGSEVSFRWRDHPSRVIRHRESEAEQIDDRADEPFSLPQCQTEDRAHRQRRGDRQGRIMGLPAGRGSGFCTPRRDRLVAKPDGQAAAAPQCCIVLRPVRDPISRSRNMITVFGMVFERHGPEFPVVNGG